MCARLPALSAGCDTKNRYHITPIPAGGIPDPVPSEWLKQFKASAAANPLLKAKAGGFLRTRTRTRTAIGRACRVNARAHTDARTRFVGTHHRSSACSLNKGAFRLSEEVYVSPEVPVVCITHPAKKGIKKG